MSRIFIQIASYRDPELIPTIRDCIAKAKHPERLTFGICWQHSDQDTWDTLDEFKNKENFKIIDVPWNESKGLCWARSLIQKLWSGEKYTMQLDSHHRFLQDWDEILIEMMGLTDSKKPILTAYVCGYEPITNTLTHFEPFKLVGSHFSSYGTIIFESRSIQDWQSLKKPIRARFVSGHFFFTLGIHCSEYKYDPYLYFAGDEISLSIRSYTLGYDLYHPHKNVIWHEYTRILRTKHWTDFNEENTKNKLVPRPWWEMDNESKRRLRHLLQEEYHSDINLGEYGLGSVRTHADYERYAGINFLHRRLHPNMMRGIDPPVNDDSDWYLAEEFEYKITLDIPRPEHFDTILIAIEDELNTTLFKQDLTEYIPQITAVFKTSLKPYKWVYIPATKEKGWGDRIDTIFPPSYIQTTILNRPSAESR